MKRKIYEYLVVFYIKGAFNPSRMFVRRALSLENISGNNILELDDFITELVRKTTPESPEAFVTDYKLLREYCVEITDKEDIICLKYNLLKDIKKSEKK